MAQQLMAGIFKTQNIDAQAQLEWKIGQLQMIATRCLHRSMCLKSNITRCQRAYSMRFFKQHWPASRMEYAQWRHGLEFFWLMKEAAPSSAPTDRTKRVL